MLNLGIWEAIAHLNVLLAFKYLNCLFCFNWIWIAVWVMFLVISCVVWSSLVFGAFYYLFYFLIFLPEFRSCELDLVLLSHYLYNQLISLCLCRYQIGLRYTGGARMLLMLSLKFGIIPIVVPVGVRDFDIDGELWVKLRLIPTEPWVGAVSWAFVSLPKIKFELSLFRLFNLMGMSYFYRYKKLYSFYLLGSEWFGKQFK